MKWSTCRGALIIHTEALASGSSCRRARHHVKYMGENIHAVSSDKKLSHGSAAVMQAAPSQKNRMLPGSSGWTEGIPL